MNGWRRINLVPLHTARAQNCFRPNRHAMPPAPVPCRCLLCSAPTLTVFRTPAHEPHALLKFRNAAPRYSPNEAASGKQPGRLFPGLALPRSRPPAHFCRSGTLPKCPPGTDLCGGDCRISPVSPVRQQTPGVHRAAVHPGGFITPVRRPPLRSAGTGTSVLCFGNTAICAQDRIRACSAVPVDSFGDCKPLCPCTAE